LRAVKGLKKALNRNDLKRAKEKVDEIARYFLDA
jgi:hypothetical protein